MGVNSLWDIVGQTARPVRLESLSRKKLAIDASIWIYQFLKAVRDAEGNTLPSSHIVGFFRRICKLLYFGILPVFVFDGGAPALKRQTINRRKERRDEQRESTLQTARKLMAIQVQRQVQGGPVSKKRKMVKTQGENDDYDEGNIEYMEDMENIQLGNQNLATSDHDFSNFRKKDEYHLPRIGEIKIDKKDERLMPKEEFNELSELGFDYVDGINIDSVDPASKEFEELPMPTQYMILSHLRLRSRLRMGYDRDHLQSLFPNSMEFSKFQIQQVQKRNFYTQRLMTVSGMTDDGNITRRIAGSKDREYSLARSENGWTLALDSGGKSADKPIHLDEFGNVIEEEEEEEDQKPEVKREKMARYSDSDSDSDFEDVPIEPEGGDKTTEQAEEDELQKALVQSIYDQETNNTQINTNIDGFDEVELKNAIAASKNDLISLQKQENYAKKKVFNINSKKKVQTSAMKQGTPDKELRIEPNSFKNSMLFNFDESKESGIDNDDAPGVDSDAIEEKQIQAETNNGKGTLPVSAFTGDVVEFSEEDEELEESEREAAVPKVVQKLPSWFNSTVDEEFNPHIQKEHEKVVESKLSSNAEPGLGTNVVLEDERAGLVDWSDARQMLGGEEKASDEEEEEDEVLITDYKVSNKEDESTEKRNPDIEKSDEIEEVVEVEDLKKKEGDEVKEPEKAPLDYDFEEEEEEKLIQQIEEEELEHEDFKHKIKQNNPLQALDSSITEEQLLQEKFQKAKRDSEEVTQTMIKDVQELLKRFGIPFITAPMEAEAQCAELMKLNLVDGIVTDDSDCFLFGGDRVYKNMFNQKSYVECYISSEIDSRLGLDQGKLIELALLLGSDYTEGIKGIGPVLAVEILAEFGSLRNFKDWFDKNTLKLSDADNSTSLKKSLLSKIKTGKFFLPESFPDRVVFDAYKRPEVDKDDTKFQWGVPNLDSIRSFLMYNVKWTQGRVDEVLVPLIRDINRKKTEGTQSTLGEFFPQELIQTRKELTLGKRMKKATDKLRR
ncbi:DNA repair protein Rad2p [[Candida] railenensis]|uniref:DNA repair protein Rad2p n=1 Tax=[Candida] railenensis TaxID=45579 RepID=A0A9P0QUE9_9ASCO|nr:DNA repair protein Rad2p [[Candida] railenensis]